MSRESVVAYLLNLVYLVTLALQLPRCVWGYVMHSKYRGTLGVRLGGQVEHRHGTARCVWFEAASLGEVRRAGTVGARVSAPLAAMALCHLGVHDQRTGPGAATFSRHLCVSPAGRFQLGDGDDHRANSS